LADLGASRYRTSAPNAAEQLPAQWHPTLLTGLSEILQYFPRLYSDSDKIRYRKCPQNVFIIARIMKIGIIDTLPYLAT
jgi:hypothetical protein